MDSSRFGSFRLALGVILVLVGGMYLVGQIFNINSLWLLWPFIIIASGGLFFAGMFALGKRGGPLAIPGSIISMVGIILFFQNLLRLWQTWSYAWGLIIVSVGVGMVISGSWSGQARMRQSGWRLARIGLTLFLVFGVISEFLFRLTPDSNQSLIGPIILISLGAISLATRLGLFFSGWAGEELRKERSLFWPVLLFGTGILWLLIELHFIHVGSIHALTRLWPLILVFIGLDILVGRRSALVSVLLAVLAVGGVAAIFIFGPQFGFLLGSIGTMLA